MASRPVSATYSLNEDSFSKDLSGDTPSETCVHLLTIPDATSQSTALP